MRNLLFSEYNPKPSPNNGVHKKRGTLGPITRVEKGFDIELKMELDHK